MSDSPPPYTSPAVDHDRDNHELEALIASLSDLDVSALSEPQSPVPTPPTGRETPPPSRISPPVTPQRNTSRLYEFHSPTKSGFTAEWSEAAFHSQGSPGGHVKAVLKQSKSHPKRRAYAVFYGRQPGVYTQWQGPLGAQAQIKGASGSVYQGYGSLSEAQAAYNYAQGKNWTGVHGLSSASLISHPPAISALPIPVDPLEPTPNPLHGAARSSGQQKWYIVYAGITPGIYLSYLESSLNTIGIARAATDSTTSLVEARRRWAVAQAANRIQFLTHPY